VLDELGRAQLSPAYRRRLFQRGEVVRLAHVPKASVCSRA
jgi:hypothetical protein